MCYNLTPEQKGLKQPIRPKLFVADDGLSQTKVAVLRSILHYVLWQTAWTVAVDSWLTRRATWCSITREWNGSRPLTDVCRWTLVWPCSMTKFATTSTRRWYPVKEISSSRRGSGWWKLGGPGQVGPTYLLSPSTPISRIPKMCALVIYINGHFS